MMKFKAAGAIAVVIAILTGISMADNTGSTDIDANIGDSISLQITPAQTQVSMASDSDIDVQATLKVTANGYYDLFVRSDTPDGKMRSWDGTNYLQDNYKLINDPMVVRWKDDYTGNGPKTDVTLTGTNQLLVTDCQEFGDVIIGFRQHIGDPTAGFNSRVDPPNQYHIGVIFTGYLHY